MALWQDGDVAVEEGKLHYYRTGGNKPPLILLHGITDSGLCWTRFAESLENEFDINYAGRTRTRPIFRFLPNKNFL